MYFLHTSYKSAVHSHYFSMSTTKILIADDDLGIVDALEVLFQDAGYTVHTTIDGSLVQQTIHSFHPDIVLLDIWMSGQNGQDICKKLKNDKTTKHIPVILVSANRDTEKISKECGADDFIAKPFDISDVLQKVAHYTN